MASAAGSHLLPSAQRTCASTEKVRDRNAVGGAGTVRADGAEIVAIHIGGRDAWVWLGPPRGAIRYLPDVKEEAE